VYIPKGTGIYIANRSVNMDKNVWGADADEFKPERWLDLPETYDSTFSVLTFIAGPHHCIGKNMSIMVSRGER
jgi:cytochrome P450